MTTTVDISWPNLFSWAECLWFLNRGFDDCMYKICDDKVRRAFDVEGEKLLVEISYAAEVLQLNWLTGEPSKKAVEEVSSFVTAWFDLGTDLAGFYRLLARNKTVADMPEHYSGLRLVAMPDLFEALAWGIIGQQINLTFAYKLKRRLVERYGETLRYEGNIYYVFPSPEVLSDANVSELREMQLSNSKASYLITIALAFANNQLSRQILLSMPDLQSRQKYLTAIKGIGTWTANYVLMKSLGERTCIPHGDAGLLNALLSKKLIAHKQDITGINNLFDEFKGWEAYLVFYLWRSLT